MRWARISLAACLGISGTFCYTNDALEANMIAAGSQVLSEMTSPRQHTNRSNDSHSELGRRQASGTCGPAFNNQKCDSNLCCSQFGYCGIGDYYCGEAYSCQPQYGICGNAPPPASTSTVSPPPPSSSSAAPSSTSITPLLPITTSTSSSVVIAPTSSTVVSSTIPSPTLLVTTNGRCGNSTTCAGSGFGSCCSQYWYCGNSIDYCGIGCNLLFGSCGGPTLPSSSSTIPQSSSSSTPTVSSTSIPPVISTSSTSPVVSTSSSSVPSSTPTSSPGSGLPISTDGSCGNGITCTGSTFGTCCSEYNYCGSSSDYCRTLFGCQPQFGICT
ncbi:uncharacterized protein PAC_06328 [Phialocephala subalpina]|uniref:Chitin-binding type-1 domain-containing protein n=1 Tax=Phialocephala subalpina TaxID=576137 RepID=A0A1L7WUN3_9HELO|nr:uncharacterized protein PAC_06328 [Phialocephala subalpina]